jgi:hypothetical protein
MSGQPSRHHRRSRTPVAASRASGVAASPSRAGREAGFAYLLALLLVVIVTISCSAVLESVAVRERREREREMMWRGNQYARAIRLFYRKVGRYPQSLDDLMQGVPDVHFLRQAYKDPMNKEDGTWRFIYLNQAGQIIGSTRFASLQQMALIDTLGLQPGAIPQSLPGQPGVPTASVASSAGNGSGASGSLMGGLMPALPYRVISADNPQEATQAYLSSGEAQNLAQQNAQSTNNGSTPAGGENSQAALLAQIQSQYPNLTPDQIQALLAQQGLTPDQIQSALNSLNQSTSNNLSQSALNNSSQSAFGSSSQNMFSSGQSQFGSSSLQSQGGAFGQTGAPNVQGTPGNSPLAAGQSPLASLNPAILQQKPTGPVDGPVLGAYLTGVGSKIDRKSVIWLHGAKKYSDWEFIWNPLEEQAAAMQQQLNQAQSNGVQGGLPVANPFGGSTGTFGGNPPSPAPSPQQPQAPSQPNLPSQPQQ